MLSNLKNIVRDFICKFNCISNCGTIIDENEIEHIIDEIISKK